MIASLHVEVGEDIYPEPYKEVRLYITHHDLLGYVVSPQYFVIWGRYCIKLLPLGASPYRDYYGSHLKVVNNEPAMKDCYAILPRRTSYLIRPEIHFYTISLPSSVLFSLSVPLVTPTEISSKLIFKAGE